MSRQAVAISTTGDEHRLGFLETSVRHWDAALGAGDSLFVTVDGDMAACARVMAAVSEWTHSVVRVGRPAYPGDMDNKHRIGVAANKNTGLELMMHQTQAKHLFLCDDDTHPRMGFGRRALRKHTELSDQVPHSMVVWGGHRLQSRRGRYATWTWPRGVLLYQTRAVVEQVGGMVEDFGLGGHEHAEWSRRIHQHGLTPAPYCTPMQYAENGTAGPATRAGSLWHFEDMRAPGETSVQLGHRRRQITSVDTTRRDWSHIEKIMDGMDGNTSFIPFGAHDNARASATLCATSTGRGAGGEQ